MKQLAPVPSSSYTSRESKESTNYKNYQTIDLEERLKESTKQSWGAQVMEPPSFEEAGANLIKFNRVKARATKIL